MRVRTLNQIVKEIQEIDPNTAINICFLRLSKTEKFPTETTGIELLWISMRSHPHSTSF